MEYVTVLFAVLTVFCVGGFVAWGLKAIEQENLVEVSKNVEGKCNRIAELCAR